MALPAFQGGHFGWISVWIVTVVAAEFFQSWVQVFGFCYIFMAIGAGPLPCLPEKFLTGRGVGFVAPAAVCTEQRASMFALFLIIVALEAYGRDLPFKEFCQLSWMGFVTVGTIVFCSLVHELTAQNRIVAVDTGDRLLRRIGVRVVAFVAVRFKYGGMDNGSFSLCLVTCLAGSNSLDDGHESRLQWAVRIVTPLTFISKEHFLMFALFIFRVALEAKTRGFFCEVIFKIRAVSFVAVVASFSRRRMVVPGVQQPGMAVQADKGIHRVGGVRVMAALAFGVAHRCVLICDLNDLDMARCAWGAQGRWYEQSTASGGVGIVAADAICPDLNIPVAARVHILVALETKVQDRHI
jgi:hypothetical protein